MKDLAVFRESVIKTEGRYRDDRLRTYLAYEEHWPYLIGCDGELAGFALVRKSKPDTHRIGEFFIKPEFRRIGVGGAAVVEILHKFLGNWEIPFQSENSAAVIFWRKTIREIGLVATEERIVAISKPQMSHDVLLSFTNYDAN
jgi:predicted acetyltransferase